MATTTPIAPSDRVFQVLGRTALLARQGNASEALIAEVRAGLPFTTIGTVAKRTGLAAERVREVIGLSERTAARRKISKRLNAVESDRLFRVARIAALAGHVLGDVAKAQDWLTRPNRALGDVIPLDQLDTELGAREVENVLQRLAFGIFS